MNVRFSIELKAGKMDNMGWSGHFLRADKLWQVFDWFFPPRCVECNRAGYLICPECLKQTKINEPPICAICGKPLNNMGQCELCKNYAFNFEYCRSYFIYGGAASAGIKSLKYHQNLELSEFFAKCLFSIYLRESWKPEVLTAAPLSKERFRERGFNQSEKIARALSRLVNVPFSNEIIEKVKNTHQQVGLNHDERRGNLQQAFLAEPALVKNRKILVIDDVMTTGTTFDECAKALKSAGASAVYCMSVATTIL